MTDDSHDDTLVTENGVELHTETELVSLESLKPYANNPKNHPEGQVEKIADSIRQYGMDQAIVIDSEGEIIKGHGRYEAAQRLGLSVVPVRWRNGLTPNEVHGARIADNKTNLDSGFDYDLLAGTFSEMDDEGLSDDEIAEMTAFDTPDISELIARDRADISDFETHPDRESSSETTSTDEGAVASDDGNGVSSVSPGDGEHSVSGSSSIGSPPPGEFECPECGHEFAPSPDDMGERESANDDANDATSSANDYGTGDDA